MPPGKPPYQVPAMTEIMAGERNGFTAASCFSGAGGGCLGLVMAGFAIGWASEFIPAAAATYRANFPTTPLDTRDIRQVQPQEVLEVLGMGVGELDWWEGSPPCAPFSTAGRRHESWNTQRKYSDTVQRVDDLFGEYCRMVEGIRPRVFTAENVSGLVKGVAKGYFKEIYARLAGAGYRVQARVLDASWLGVPQARQRLFIAGVREDLGLAPVFPVPLPYRYTVRDALPHIAAGADGGLTGGDMLAQAHHDAGRGYKIAPGDEPALTITAHGVGNVGPHQAGIIGQRVVHDTSGDRSQGDVTDQPAPTILTGDNGLDARHYQVRVIHDTSGQPQYSAGDVTDRPAPAVLERNANYQVTGPTGVTCDPETGEDITIGRYAIGAEWAKLAPGGKSGRFRDLQRPDTARPLPTVTAGSGSGVFQSAAGVTHWAECRKLTLGELRRLCSFPDDFVLTGSYKQRWERCGRAVPPLMMYHLAVAMRDGVLIPLREAGRI